MLMQRLHAPLHYKPVGGVLTLRPTQPRARSLVGRTGSTQTGPTVDAEVVTPSTTKTITEDVSTIASPVSAPAPPAAPVVVAVVDPEATSTSSSDSEEAPAAAAHKPEPEKPKASSTPAPEASSSTETEEAGPVIAATFADASSSTQNVQSHSIQLTEEDESDYFASQELIAELKDPKQFGRRGEALVFAQIAAILLVIFPPLNLQGLIDLMGTLALTAGIVFLVYGLLSLGRNFNPMPAPRKKHELVTTGMYGYVRHPMYAGLVLVAVGMAAVLHSETRFVMSVLLWWILEQKVGYEERALSERYPEYAEYKKKVKKFVPYLY